MRRLSLSIILTASVLTASAQVSVEAVIDSIEIFVGQQAHVTLTATAQENAKVELSDFSTDENNVKPTTLSSRYTQVSLEELLQFLMSL